MTLESGLGGHVEATLFETSMHCNSVESCTVYVALLISHTML